MMKSVILLLMILGVGGWVLSHSASYIAHRRAAHGPLTPRLFSWKLRDTPAFRQALEETIVFLDNRRDWAARECAGRRHDGPVLDRNQGP